MSSPLTSARARIVLEAVVIVGSILLAFAIDAAWDNRVDHQRRDALLTAVAADMSRARAEIDRVYDFHDVGREAARRLLNLSAESTDASLALTVDSLVGAAWGSTASYDSPAGAVESLFGAGAIDLIGDADLAFELTAFPALVDDLGREQAMLQAMALELHAYLRDQGVDASLFQLGAFEVPWETGPTDVLPLVGTAPFRSMVSMMWYRYTNTTNTLVQLRDAIARIEARLPGA